MKASKNYILIALVVAGLAVLLFGGYYFLVIKKGNLDFSGTGRDTSDIVKFPDNPQKGDPGYNETKTTISADNTDRFAGNFEKIEAGRIVISQNGVVLQSGNQDGFLFNEDEIAVQCTSQSLVGANTVDLALVTEVMIQNSERLGGMLTAGTPVFLLTENSEGFLRAHTIVVPANICVL